MPHMFISDLLFKSRKPRSFPRNCVDLNLGLLQSCKVQASDTTEAAAGVTNMMARSIFENLATVSCT